MTTRIRLIIDATFDTNDTAIGDLVDNMTHIANNAANNGMLTGESAAEVVEWESLVEVVESSNPFCVKKIEAHPDRVCYGVFGPFKTERAATEWANAQEKDISNASSGGGVYYNYEVCEVENPQ